MAGHDYTIPMELPEGFKCVECPEPVEGLAWVYMLLMRNEMQCFYSLHSRVEPTTTIRKRPTCPFILNSLLLLQFVASGMQTLTDPPQPRKHTPYITRRMDPTTLFLSPWDWIFTEICMATLNQ